MNLFWYDLTMHTIIKYFLVEKYLSSLWLKDFWSWSNFTTVFWFYFNILWDSSPVEWIFRLTSFKWPQWIFGWHFRGDPFISLLISFDSIVNLKKQKTKQSMCMIRLAKNKLAPRWASKTEHSKVSLPLFR